MATNESSELTPTQLQTIWKNLVYTDQRENNFRFSKCRNRRIVVLNAQKTTNYIVGDIIQHHTYANPSHPVRNDEQSTITYVMAPGETECNVCIINLIDIPPIESFLKRLERTRKDPTPSPMPEIDRTIYKFATNIDLIVLVCAAKHFELMKHMKKWAANRAQVMALAFIVDPSWTSLQRDEFVSSIRENKEFLDNDLDRFFSQGIFCLSDLSYNHFRSAEEQQMAQSYVKIWRSKFLRACVGDKDDPKYEIQPLEDHPSRSKYSCQPS